MSGKMLNDVFDLEKRELIEEFLEDIHDRDNKRDCKYRCGALPCKYCTNYKYCSKNNYPIIKKWEEKLKKNVL